MKKRKKKKINFKMPHVNKKRTCKKRNFGSNKKQGLERTVNGLGKAFKKFYLKNSNKHDWD